MTIKEYFSQTQPINNDVVDEIFYANTQKIIFGNNPNKYAQIEVAHIDEDTWAFGWEIADNGKLLKRHCTTRITTRGPINRLIYGMTKVLRRQLEKQMYHTHFVEKLIDDAIEEACTYCQCNKSDMGKIAI